MFTGDTIRQLTCESFSLTVWSRINAFKSDTTKRNDSVDSYQESTEIKGDNWNITDCRQKKNNNKIKISVFL